MCKNKYIIIMQECALVSYFKLILGMRDYNMECENTIILCICIWLLAVNAGVSLIL